MPRINRTHRRSRIREYFFVRVSYTLRLHVRFSLRCSLFPASLFSFVTRYAIREQNRDSISSNDAREDVPSRARIAFRDNVDMLTHCLLMRDVLETAFSLASRRVPLFSGRERMSLVLFPIDREFYSRSFTPFSQCRIYNTLSIFIYIYMYVYIE